MTPQELTTELAYLATCDDADTRRSVRALLPTDVPIPYADVWQQAVTLEGRNPSPAREAVWKERVRGLVTF